MYQPNPTDFELNLDAQKFTPEKVEIERATAQADEAFDNLLLVVGNTDSEYVPAVDLFEMKSLLLKAGFATSWPIAEVIKANQY
ncbi:hypothetical protein OH460_08825 [Vibrio sp. Makdt]|uniref:hypothetical protein n=1 Tax=Vibrio sp. Makdt TaxID=2998828 RepID=UPI0022CD570A|nr:hypothetical protein [Vibrio sp. Makdt]MDA0152404.1 hypothetical protein [Vibrio sp. Makdt]